MAQATNVIIMNPVEAAHTALLAKITVEKPHRIRYCADRRDLEERAEHIKKILGATLEYVGAIVSDTAYVAPGGSIDEKYLLGLIIDVASDVAGFIANAAVRAGQVAVDRF